MFIRAIQASAIDLHSHRLGRVAGHEDDLRIRDGGKIRCDAVGDRCAIMGAVMDNDLFAGRDRLIEREEEMDRGRTAASRADADITDTDRRDVGGGDALLEGFDKG